MQVFAFCSTHLVGWVSIVTGGFLPPPPPWLTLLPLWLMLLIERHPWLMLKDTQLVLRDTWLVLLTLKDSWLALNHTRLVMLTVKYSGLTLLTPLACITHIETHLARTAHLKHSGARIAHLKQCWPITLSYSHGQKRQPTWPSSFTYITFCYFIGLHRASPWSTGTPRMHTHTHWKRAQKREWKKIGKRVSGGEKKTAASWEPRKFEHLSSVPMAQKGNPCDHPQLNMYKFSNVPSAHVAHCLVITLSDYIKCCFQYLAHIAHLYPLSQYLHL
jgi:hypothetical protein